MSSMATRTKVALLLSGLLVATGCVSGGSVERSAPVESRTTGGSAASASTLLRRDRSGPGERAAAVALRQVGVPYRYGGQSRAGFDCSGLVHYSYGQVGVSAPRTTAALWQTLEPVPAGSVRVGDVLFFDIAGKVSHVGLYLGEGRFVHAPSTGRTVSVARLDEPFYSKTFIRAGRLRPQAAIR
jgi:cell wall-associated NlpC family hydrolase